MPASLESFPGGSDGKESAWNMGDLGFDPWVGKISWRRKWQPTLVFFPQDLITLVSSLVQEHPVPEGMKSNTSCIPNDSRLGYILSHWHKFSLD